MIDAIKIQQIILMITIIFFGKEENPPFNWFSSFTCHLRCIFALLLSASEEAILLQIFAFLEFKILLNSLKLLFNALERRRIFVLRILGQTTDFEIVGLDSGRDLFQQILLQ